MSIGTNRSYKVCSIENALGLFIRDRDSTEIRRLKTRFLEGFLKFLGDYQKQVECTNHIFALFQDDIDDDTIKKKKLYNQCEKMGILKDDPRISRMVEYLEENCGDDIDIMELTFALKGKGVNAN